MTYLKRAYPYPVLGRADDFPAVAFDCEYTLTLDSSNSAGNLTIQYDIQVGVAELKLLLDSDEALIGFDIYSKQSFYREIVSCSTGNGEVRVPTKLLAGEVIVTPLIFASKSLSSYSPQGANDEFGNSSFQIIEGDVLGVGDARSIFLSYDRESNKSIVRVVVDETLPELSYNFIFASDQILVCLGSKANEVWSKNYFDSQTRPYLVMSILKDCILMALSQIANSEEGDELSFWALKLREKLSENSIKLNSETSLEDLNLHAQKLIQDRGINLILKENQE